MSGNKIPDSLRVILDRRAAEEARQQKEKQFAPIRDFRLNELRRLKEAVRYLRDGSYSEAAKSVCEWKTAIKNRGTSGHLTLARELLLNVVKRRRAESYLSDSVPRGFQNFNELKHPCAAALSNALSLKLPSAFSENGEELDEYRGGIFAHGPTGSGKTRAMIELLKKWIRKDNGVRFRMVSAPVLKRQMGEAARAGRSNEFIEELLSNEDEILFIDDLSQAQFSPSFAEGLFELINRVYAEQHWLIVTVQCSADELQRLWIKETPDRFLNAEGIVRRLKEYCTPVKFTKAAPSVRQAGGMVSA